MKRMQGGTIIISITNHTTHTVISVADDGVGMAEDMLEQLQQRKAQTDSGVGLLNTDLRLKRQFGNGLQIKSSSNGGTEVSFVVYHNHLS
ncbi:Histidine kinase-, DNA gyrase B-, and HSP90-like ATPase [compost metagenome]